MATKKKRRTPTKRRAATKTKTTKRRGTVQRMGFAPSLQAIGLGIIGAVVASKVAPMVPVGDNRVKYGALTLLGAFMASKPGMLRPLGVGLGIASGTMLLGELMPNLLGPAPAPGTVNRLSPETQRRMQKAAESIRTNINGARNRTIMGSGDTDSVIGSARSRTIMGSGETSISY